MTAQGESRGDLGRAAAVHPSEHVCDLYDLLAEARAVLDAMGTTINALSRDEMTFRAQLGITTAATGAEEVFKTVVE